MDKIFKKKRAKVFLVSLVIPLIFFSVSLLNINDYGETTDEKFDQHIGEFYYYQWKEKGLAGLNKRFIELQRNYGPFFDIISVASNDILYRKTNLIKNPVASYHFPVIISSTIAIWIVFVFSYINWGIVPAFFSSLTLALMPRFIGDSQNNLKDNPTMTFFSITLLFYFLAIKKKKLFYYFLAGIFLGLAYTIKINAVIVIPLIFFWYLLENEFNFKETKKFSIFFIISLITAFITILVFWPYYRYNPPTRFIETYNTFKNHVWNEYILYLGEYYRGHEIPWHYPFVMFGVTTPIFYLGLLSIGFLISIYSWFLRNFNKSPLIFLLLWLFFPVLIQILSGAPMYDGIRHFLVVLPPIAILIGFITWWLGNFLKKLKRGKIIYLFYTLIIFLGYFNILLTDIRFHPYQIVYFNEITGGTRGAKVKFDLDYWGQSLREAAEWINKNLPDNSRIWLTIPMAHHFPIDKTRFYLVNRLPDYKVSLIRGMLKTWDTEEDYLNPKRIPIYTINVDGADILQIFEYPENHQFSEQISLDPLFKKISPNGHGLKITIYPNNQFVEPFLKTIISPSLGFDCLNNDYNDKAISLKYEGYLYIPESKLYCFQLRSDDDSLLKLNDTNVIVNPSMETSIRKVILGAGYYKFQLDYLNNAGPACLQLLWSTNNCQDYIDIPSGLILN